MDLATNVEIVGLLRLDRNLAGEKRDALLGLAALELVLEPLAPERACLFAPLDRTGRAPGHRLGELHQGLLALLRRRMAGEEAVLGRIAARLGLKLEQQVAPDLRGFGRVVAGLVHEQRSHAVRLALLVLRIGDPRAEHPQPYYATDEAECAENRR